MNQIEILTMWIWVLAVVLVMYVAFDLVSEVRIKARRLKRIEEFKLRFSEAFAFYDNPAKDEDLKYLTKRVNYLVERVGELEKGKKK